MDVLLLFHGVIRNHYRTMPAPPASSSLASADPLRVLVASHSHPELTSGGAEIAAFELYTRLNADPRFEAWFLGCDRSGRDDRAGAVFSQPFSEREFLYQTGAFDWQKFANQDPRFPEEFTALLRELRPDVVHFHHYINFGVEAFAHVRRVLPQCRIFLTLHEYLAICNHYGQMVTTSNDGLCYRASPLRCHRCFPQLSGADFFLREMYIRRFLDLVDQFISPSHFLAERYIAWGIPREKMQVIENVLPDPPSARLRPGTREVLRVGFFGQISRLKGIDVVFQAAEMLEHEGCTGVTFEIFGDHRAQPEEFQKQFRERLAHLPGNLHLHGPYERERVTRLMQTVDVVLVPSVWWENSPLVIQEALRARRPLICSDIGGMAEKVEEGVNGFLFPAGSSVELAQLLRQLAADPEQLRRIERTAAEKRFDDSPLQAHLRLYAEQHSCHRTPPRPEGCKTAQVLP